MTRARSVLPAGRAGRRSAGSPAARARVLALAACATLASGCGDAGSVVVVTPLPDALVSAAEESFRAAHPEIPVRFLRMPDAAVADALAAGDLQADVWWGADWLRLVRAERAGHLRRVTEGGGRAWSPVLAIPLWLGGDGERLTRSEVPRLWQDLFHNRWWGEAVMPPPAAPETTALVAFGMLTELRRTGTEDAGADWLQRLDRLVAATAEDPRDQIRRLSIGEGRFGFFPAEPTVWDEPVPERFIVWEMDDAAPLRLHGVAALAGPTRPDGAEAFYRWASTEGGGVGMLRRILGGSQPLPPAGMLDTLHARGDAWMERWESEIRGRSVRVP